MQAQATNPQPQDVMITVGGEHSPIHARLVGRLRTKDADGAPMFLVSDETGMPRIVREQDVIRLTTGPILRAEEYISSVITSLALRYAGDYDESGEWITQCVCALNGALYELSKPEATRTTP